MAVDVGKLRVKLGLNDKEFQTGMKNANTRLQAFSRRLAIGAGALAGAAAAGLAVATKRSFQTVDAQAKLAQSLGTTTKSIQVLARAGDLAGVSMAGIEQGAKDLTRRLSQAAASGKGGTFDALERLKLSAEDLMKLPLDERVRQINGAIEKFIPAAERAAVAGQLFGEEGSIAMGRLDAATLDQAIKDVEDFGVAVSDVDADKIEEANDAVSRLGLIATGTGNKLAVALAPMVTAAAEAIANLFREGGAAYIVIGKLTENMGRLAAWAGTAAAIVGGRLAISLGAAVLGVRGLTFSFVALKAALIRTGIGAIIVLAGEMVYQFMRLVKGSGGFGKALGLLKDVAVEVFQRIGDSGTVLSAAMGIVTETIKSKWLGMISVLQKKWGDFLYFMGDSISGLPVIGAFSEGLIAASDRMVVAYSNTALAAADAEAAAFGYSQETLAAGAALYKTLPALQALLAALKAADADADNAGTSLADLQKQLDGLGNLDGGGKGLAKKLKDTTDKIKTLSEDLRDTLQSSFSSAFEGLLAGTASVREALAGIFADLAKMAANRLIQNLLGGLFGGGVGGGILGGLIPGFATGTRFAPGGLAVVGERGPELVNLPRGSQVTPNNQLAGIGSPNVNIVNVLDPALVGDYLRTSQGEALIMNVINRNK